MNCQNKCAPSSPSSIRVSPSISPATMPSAPAADPQDIAPVAIKAPTTTAPVNTAAPTAMPAMTPPDRVEDVVVDAVVVISRAVVVVGACVVNACANAFGDATWIIPVMRLELQSNTQPYG